MSRSEKSKTDAKAEGVITTSSKALSATGVVAAMAVTILLNILSARHYERWDFTTSRLYTLSPATLTTLRALQGKVQVEVLLSSTDPLRQSVQNLLEAYGGETSRLEVRYVDPDRYPAEFVAVQQKYGIVAGRSEDGRVVTDAAIVMASGERRWFITSDDMVDFSEVDEGKTKSKLEQSLTEGIRAVLGGERRRICFTFGHGEFSLDDNSSQGLGELRERLAKNNYEPVTVGATDTEPATAYDKCDAIAVCGPGTPFSKGEADAISKRMRDGMSGVFMLNPMLDADSRRQLDTGLEPVAKMFGIRIANDYVFEMDDDARVPRGTGEVFFPALEEHATTDGLVGASLALSGLRIVVMRSRSFDSMGGDAKPKSIMKTSDAAFGMTDFFSWIEKGGEPTKGPSDRGGPLSVGMAAELPKPEGSDRPHGARLVVLGTANPALGQNWRDLSLRGNAVLVGNIVSWIASKPPIVDVPAKVTPAATLRITEESLDEIMRYVLLFLPGAAILLGVAVHLRRRSREDNRPKLKGPKLKDPEPKDPEPKDPEPEDPEPEDPEPEDPEPEDAEEKTSKDKKRSQQDGKPVEGGESGESGESLESLENKGDKDAS